MEKSISFYIWCFFTCSVFGWTVETLWKSILHREFRNSGVLFGPYVPIYGFGCLAIVLVLGRFIDKVKSMKFKCGFLSVLLIIVGVFVLVSALEYFAHWLLETLFDKYWWYYGNSDRYVINGKVYNLHLNGRVSLRSALMLTIGGCGFVYWVFPILKKLFSKFNPRVLKYGAVVIAVVMGTDTVLTVLRLYGVI